MDDNVLLNAVIRSLGAAWRALRLYPPASPMTHEVAHATCSAVDEYLQAEPSIRLEVVREGFVMRGLDGVLTAPGIEDFVEALALHGVGEIHFTAPPATDELIALLSLVQMQPVELHEQGGMQKGLTQANVVSIRAVAVTLAKVEAPPEIPEEEAEKFLQMLAGDPGRLAVWLRSLLTADDEGLTEGILMLSSAAGDVRVFGRTLALAFRELDATECDRLLECAIALEPLREITSEMLSNLTAVEITAAIRGGAYGANLMAASYALSSLPLGARAQEVTAEMESALLAADTSPQDIEFLKRITSVRASGVLEQPLDVSQPYYAAAAAAVAMTPEQREAASRALVSGAVLDAGGVACVLYLLDSSPDMDSYTATLGALSRAVPALIESGSHPLALRIADELMQRLANTDRAWEGLDIHFARAVDVMCGSRSMAALLALDADEATAVVKALVALCGEPAALSLAASSVESPSDASLDIAEHVLGRRLAELLASSAGTVDDSRAAKLAELFARDGSPRCLQALHQMAERSEDKVRLETARGLGAVGGQVMTALVPKLLRDSSVFVSGFMARTLARHATPEVAALLAARLDELEGDADIALARDLIATLSRSPHPAARDALERAASRGGRLRKGRFAELRQLAADALADKTPVAEGT